MRGLRFRRACRRQLSVDNVRQCAAYGAPQEQPLRTRSTMRSVASPYRSCRVGRAPASRNCVGQGDRLDLAAESGPGGGGGDGLEQPADHGVVLAGEREAVGVDLGEHGRGVERLEGGGVDDRDVDVVRGEPLGGLQGPHGHQSAGDEDDVATGAQHLRLAELEGVVVLVEHGRHLAAQQPEVGRPGGGGELRDGLLDVDGVAGVDDGEPGDAAEDGDVLGGLVAGAVAGGQARAVRRRR